MTSKAEQCYRILKQRIMDRSFGPGHRLVIDQLGREYNISSVPWRESLRRLEAEGWVDIIPEWWPPWPIISWLLGISVWECSAPGPVTM